MKIALNVSQIKALSNFFSNMAVAWFIGAFITPRTMWDLVLFSGYGIVALTFSVFLLKKEKT
ncbi:hypothetical protein HY086_05270 [Candidatus Gottesmanbacteria bacterium]|nr:hypothetical protein [Candidatus Gottesmanbacteria bacterium]